LLHSFWAGTHHPISSNEPIETVKKCHEEEEEIACEGKLRECLITENDSELLLKE